MSLADRIKRYEKTFSFQTLNRMPVMIRVDGKAFHTLTRDLNKPFDRGFIDAMVSAASEVAKEMQGFKVGYVQSDEATFCLTDYDNLDTQGWFDYDLAKIVSISAALMSTAFHVRFRHATSKTVFDSRAFSVPPDDVVNAFLWRAKDWERNSLQMYARSFFSHRELMNKNHSEIHEMLHGIGKNWVLDLTDQERNGTFLILGVEGIETRTNILPTYQAINEAFGKLFERNFK
jgi:tRNA(His) 5'-end guanylyltransferase